MKLFLSWSGERSHRVAELIGDWISGVIQRIRPWISSDMDRGTIWFPEIGEAISSVENGIVCLTRENLSSPWILFESGALARNASAKRVCTFLIDIVPSDVRDPLAQFNHTMPQKESMFQLAKTLNRRLGEDALSDTKLESEFELHWPYFEQEFEKIISETPTGEEPPQKTDREILDEMQGAIRRLERAVVRAESMPLKRYWKESRIGDELHSVTASEKAQFIPQPRMSYQGHVDGLDCIEFPPKRGKVEMET